ncbi:unnamed protein product, partial [Rotaria sp. Silwood2]
YYVSKAVVAFRGRPHFLFCPKAMSLADDGGLQDFNLIAIPMTCLQINSLKKFGQLQVPLFHSVPSLDKVTFHIPN